MKNLEFDVSGLKVESEGTNDIDYLNKLRRSLENNSCLSEGNVEYFDMGIERKIRKLTESNPRNFTL